MSDLPGALVATLFTLAIFSRVWKPNPLFRLAEHLLLGLLTGYVAAIALRGVLWPGLAQPLLQAGPQGSLLLYLGLIVLLALRFGRRPALRVWGLLPLGILVGGAAALAVAGALRGTLVPQILAAANMQFLPEGSAFLNAALAALAALTTAGVVLYLQQRPRPPASADGRLLAWLGEWGYLALMIAFGALLATTAGARLTLLIDRIYYLIDLWARG